MKIAFYTNCVSSHQLPLANEIVKCVGVDNFRYVDAALGGQPLQTVNSDVSWVTRDTDWCEAADMLYTGGLRPIELIERRAARGLKTYYYSERWFKPWHGLPGSLRMLVSSYRKMAKRFVKWANTDPNARILAIGPWAKKDFLRMGVNEDKIVPWGYFVAPSASEQKRKTPTLNTQHSNFKTLKVLWAGRDIPLKHVKDIERAVALANKNLTSIVPLPLDSPTCPISFTKLTGVTPAEVRKAMREHDTFVFASNGFEGWGAVVSEALEEGMNAIGTFECGAPPTLLPRERLFHCGDVKALALLLEAEFHSALPPCSIGEWTAKSAAEKMLELIK